MRRFSSGPKFALSKYLDWMPCWLPANQVPASSQNIFACHEHDPWILHVRFLVFDPDWQFWTMYDSLFQSKALDHPMAWEQGKIAFSLMEPSTIISARRWKVLSQWANSIERLRSTTAANCIQETESESLPLLPLEEEEDEVAYLEAKKDRSLQFWFVVQSSQVFFFWSSEILQLHLWSDQICFESILWSDTGYRYPGYHLINDLI